MSCIAYAHDPMIVLLAAFVCVAGGFVTIELLRRARSRRGAQQAGWTFLAAVAAGSAVWCTHFIAILAYDSPAPVVFDPILTFLSLVIVIVGAALAFTLALARHLLVVGLGGVVLGLAIPAMHYTGMLAYRVDGLVTWDMNYVAASLVLCVVLAIAALVSLGRAHSLVSLAFLALATVSLHFTGMTAVSITPFVTGATLADPSVGTAMAVAVAGVALLIVGTGVTSFLIDSSVSQAHVVRLRHMALSDTLTGLPNRASFSDRILRDIEHARLARRPLAIIGIDLDKFKEINDARGHEVGDAVLRQIGRTLAGLMDEDGFVARIGGDEFAALKPFAERRELEEFVSRLEAALFAPVELDGYTLAPGASIGISIYPDDGTNPDRLVGNADLAMYRAKTDPVRAVCYFEAGMDEVARRRRDLAADLRLAIPRGELLLHYQVQTSVAVRGAVVGYEVLLRWRHPRFGLIPPADFIPLAEETGQIVEIGEWVLREASREAASWAGGEKIAVNLSAVQLADRDLPNKVHAILIESGLSPARLELEITESSIIRDEMRAIDILRRLRSLGITIAIDDFGTGYSSLATLRSFPFDRIKLDRSFMGEIGECGEARAIIRAVLALGKSLKTPVLAEGVETEEQFAILVAEGCDEAQGYLLGRPGPMEAAELGLRRTA
ncbi:EAL domain-containing protein [Chelativorans sp. ZYF759]|uniref:putative bifunctional diguanylate cyclase/phosphodiesterase n=1 Tax=Chelativorans sp. ZYF759 TaxID=2692213 RepID=UPI00145E3489|nr:EAL domain-containing protein [Chelativorans sp. ZYF759]